jgi:hypothetical protein
MNRTLSYLAAFAALLSAAMAGSFACVTNSGQAISPEVDAGDLFGDAGFPEDSALVEIDGAITLKDGAVVLAPSNVPTPDYTTDVSNLVLQHDANARVSSLGGTVDLAFHTVSGDAYLALRDQNLAGWTFAQLDGLWNASDAGGATAIGEDAGTVQIPAGSLVALGDLLPYTSSVLVMRREGGVATYQALVITFNPK